VSYDPSEMRTAQRLVSTGETGIYRLARAYQAMIEAFGYGDDQEMTDFVLRELEWKLDDIERAVTLVRNWAETERARVRMRVRIAALRNTSGRTPEETQAYHAKADELERAMETAIERG